MELRNNFQIFIRLIGFLLQKLHFFLNKWTFKINFCVFSIFEIIKNMSQMM